MVLGQLARSLEILWGFLLPRWLKGKMMLVTLELSMQVWEIWGTRFEFERCSSKPSANTVSKTFKQRFGKTPCNSLLVQFCCQGQCPIHLESACEFGRDVWPRCMELRVGMQYSPCFRHHKRNYTLGCQLVILKRCTARTIHRTYKNLSVFIENTLPVEHTTLFFNSTNTFDANLVSPWNSN